MFFSQFSNCLPIFLFLFLIVDWDSLLAEARRKETAENSPSKSSADVIRTPTILLFSEQGQSHHLLPENYSLEIHGNMEDRRLSTTPETTETTSTRVTESENNSPSRIADRSSLFKYQIEAKDACHRRSSENSDFKHRKVAVSKSTITQYSQTKHHGLKDQSRDNIRREPPRMDRTYSHKHFRYYGNVQHPTCSHTPALPAINLSIYDDDDVDDITSNQC